MEMSTLRGLHLDKQVNHDNKGLMAVMTPKYNPMNDCSKDTPVYSEVAIIIKINISNHLPHFGIYVTTNENIQCSLSLAEYIRQDSLTKEEY
jgi:hypothetical protein